jgi:hypothetical protein
MTANELRIGNWYTSVKFGVPVQCELSDLDQLCTMADGAYDDPPINEMFEPIPLTEEWLLKLGFEQTYINISLGNDYFYIDLNKRNSLVIRPRNDLFVGCWEWGFYGQIGHGGIINIKYVHQLQNLYFVLTGEELIMKSQTVK